MREIVGLIGLIAAIFFIVQMFRKRKTKGAFKKNLLGFFVGIIILGWGFYDNRPSYGGIKVTEPQEEQLTRLADAEQKTVWQFSKKNFDEAKISERAYSIRKPFLKLNGATETNKRLLDGWVSAIKDAPSQTNKDYAKYLAFHAIQKVNRKTANHVTSNTQDSNTLYKHLDKNAGLTK
ncbi:hypothetical protein [Levilactobacillus senmaizukei]|uniref:hypothetical protein n=1 Tax=Levilactobacillus senmaizukei TaxID=431273 RepID=UPI00077BE3F9|nr:hypothetical protein [Levilactobacillus senmaizukei]